VRVDRPEQRGGTARSGARPPVGDRWVYHVVDGYPREIVWDETHEITAA
jgi:hypothetical protein